MKKTITSFIRIIKKIAFKAAESLPSIIGAIVSWLFSTAGKVIGYMGEHLWTLIVLVVGILIAIIKKN